MIEKKINDKINAMNEFPDVENDTKLEKIVRSLTAHINDVNEKNLFGKTIDEVIIQGTHFAAGMAMNCLGGENYIAVGTILSNLGYSTLSKTNAYGYAKNLTLGAANFAAGYILIEAMKNVLK